MGKRRGFPWETNMQWVIVRKYEYANGRTIPPGDQAHEKDFAQGFLGEVASRPPTSYTWGLFSAARMTSSK